MEVEEYTSTPHAKRHLKNTFLTNVFSMTQKVAIQYSFFFISWLPYLWCQ